MTIFDKNFSLIENLKQSHYIFSLCNITDFSFAIGLQKGHIKIYTKNSSNKKYEIKEFKHHTREVNCLLYLPKKNYLISGSYDKTINILSLSEDNVIKRLYDHNILISSLIYLNEECFASSSFKEIKIWSIKSQIECIKTIQAHENSQSCIYLYPFGQGFMVSHSYGDKFMVWDTNNHECIKTFKEDSNICDMIVTKNKKIITITYNKINIWQGSK